MTILVMVQCVILGMFLENACANFLLGESRRAWYSAVGVAVSLFVLWVNK